MKAVPELVQHIRDEMNKVVVGQDELRNQCVIALLCRGHVLLEGVPGIAKTLTVKALSRLLRLEFQRVQCTSDLMPADIVGTNVLNMVDSFEQLKIDTPEQIALELPLAGIGSRFLAIAIDTLIQVALYLITGLIFLLLLPEGFSIFTFLPKTLGPAMAIFVGFAIYWGYFAVFEVVWKGQTPGKRVAGIRVIKESGRPINAFEAIGRNLMRAVDVMPGIYGVGLVCMTRPSGARLPPSSSSGNRSSIQNFFVTV